MSSAAPARLFTIWTHISAVQTDGSVRTYDGTYTVANGEIVSANITQTS
jgi:hypothetical protein